MDYRPELNPASSGDFPLERARIYHLEAGLYALKIARSRMPETIKPVETPTVMQPGDVKVKTEEVAYEQPVELTYEQTATEKLAEIREQIKKEAA